jgi:hypothetical protein
MVPTSGFRVRHRHQREISAVQIARSREDALEREDGVREKVMHRLDVKKPARGGLLKKKRSGKEKKEPQCPPARAALSLEVNRDGTISA